jgi:hypothetical protein
MVKAIDTEYNGYLFRSRLEARWAVFFDSLDIKYRYEVEGFDLDGVYYLPDFWLPHIVPELAADGWGLWVEIKPLPISEDELKKAVSLVEKTKHNMVIFQGDPWPEEYSVLKISGTHCSPPRHVEGLSFFQEVFGYIHLKRSKSSSGGSYPAAYGGDLQGAYKAARQARFEHGERPFAKRSTRAGRLRK